MPEIAPLPEPLYAAIGHMALAAAKLEWMVASCLVVIGDVDSPDTETGSLQPVGTNIKKLRAWLASDGRVGGQLGVRAGKWLDDAQVAIHDRNRIVHSVMVMDGADDGGPAPYHPRSGEIHLPTVGGVNAITEDLHRCAGVGLMRSKEFAELVGYGSS
jgi:hypothetical protein